MWIPEKHKAALRKARQVMAALACAFAATGAFAQRKVFTLEQVMGSPFPTELVASPSGAKLAWVFNEKGARNVWLAETSRGAYHSHRLTNYTEDDGQDIGQLAWAPDSTAIIYTRGGDLELNRTYPNPDSLVQGVEQDVWAVSLAGGAPRKLGEGHSPAVSPKGTDVAYIFKGQVWLAKLDGSQKPEQLIHANGNAAPESLRWSPDGARLAFVSARTEHSLIGVYDFAHRTLVYLEPSVDHDRSPVWSPDGRRIAFIRIPSSQRATAFGPKREGRPWSIRTADAATGAGHETWRAQPGTGSVFRGIVSRNQILWCAGDRLAFPWERDGWTHLYSMPASGGAATLLTPGPFEVEHVSLAPDGRRILYSSNQGDIDRRHIWRVSPEGGRPQAITSGAGIEWSPVETSDGRTIAVLRSDARWPARPAVVSGRGLEDIARDAIPSDFPAAELVVPRQVIFSAADGLLLHGQLFLPANERPGERYPAIVFFHGGSRRQMLLGWHYMGYYHNAYAMNQYLASRAYVVFSVNYRSGIGYGMEFREPLDYGAAGASEFNDVQGAGLYLRSRADVDPKRIGVWGGSYGGYLTAMALARASDMFAAGVDLHGVHDWNLEIRNWIPAYNPRAHPHAAEIAWESSPLASVKTWRSPVLLVQGDDDRNVPFTETIHLVEALRRQKVEFKQLVLPDEIHDFLMHRSWLAAYHAGSDFFDAHLKR